MERGIVMNEFVPLGGGTGVSDITLLFIIMGVSLLAISGLMLWSRYFKRR